jgi:predicted NAD/FAD-binding protein
MSFGFHYLENGFVYAGNDLNGLFAQRINLLRLQFYRFLFEYCDTRRSGKSGRVCTAPSFPTVHGRQLFKTHGGVQVQSANQHHEFFDQVVLATHADQTLRLLGDPTPEEARLLAPWQYEKNHTGIHTDLSVLPPMPRAWSFWNFRSEGSGSITQPAYVTNAMNLLQGLTINKQYLVTLNHPSAYDENHVIARMGLSPSHLHQCLNGNSGQSVNLKRSSKYMVLRQLFRLRLP